MAEPKKQPDAAESNVGQNWLPYRQAAAALAIAPRTLQTYGIDGCPRKKIGQVYHFDLEQTREWMKANGKGYTGSATQAAGEEVLDWDNEKKKWSAKKTQAEYEALIRELIPAEEVKRERAARVLAVRSALLNRGSRLAQKIGAVVIGEGGVLNIPAIQKILDDDAVSVCNEFAKKLAREVVESDAEEPEDE